MDLADDIPATASLILDRADKRDSLLRELIKLYKNIFTLYFRTGPI